MERSKSLVLHLIFGLCFVHVYSGNPNGDCPFDDYKRLMKKLEEIDAQKQHLRELFKISTDRIQQDNIEREFPKLYALEHKIKDACKSLENDELIKMTADQKLDFLKEKEKLRLKLITAEGMYGQARNFASENRERVMQSVYQERVDLAAEVRDKIAKDFEEFTEERFVNNLKKQQLATDEEHKMKVQKVLNAMAPTLQERTKGVPASHQDELNELRNNLIGLFNTNNDKLFQQTKLRLEALLQKLYQEGQFSPATPLRDLESELVKIEEDAIRKRDQEHKRRMDLLGELMSKSLEDYTEEEITSLEYANMLVVTKDKELEEVASRIAYLKAISQVADLIKECSETTWLGTDKSQGQQGPSVVGGSSVSGHQDPGEEVQDLATIIHEKCLHLKLQLDLFRNQLNTDIAAGLYRVNKKIPSVFGCDTTQLTQIRDKMRKWVANVKYALRFSKKLYKDGEKPKQREMCMGFLAGMWNSLFGNSNGKNQQDVGLEGDDEKTQSIEVFGRQRNFDFENHFAYIEEHLSLLDVDSRVDEKSLKELRFNFIAVREVSDLLKYVSQKVLQEAHGYGSSGNTANVMQGSKAILELANNIEKGLRRLFDATKSRVKSNIDMQVRKFESAVKENDRCRAKIHNEIDKLSLFDF